MNNLKYISKIDFNRYIRFIESRKNRILNSNYFEYHHIIPKSMGGNDNDNNLLKLTGREHFVAHMILWKAFGGKMTQAFWLMNNRNMGLLTSRQYQSLKEEMSVLASKPNIERFGEEKARQMSNKMSNSRKGRSWEEYFGKEKAEQIRKIHIQPKGTWIQRFGEEKAKQMKQNLGLKLKNLGSLEKRHGLKKANEIKNKMSNSRKGKSWDDLYKNAPELRKRMSERMSGPNNPFLKLTKEQRKLASQKSAETTKRLGLLKGTNHPLYGKRHTKESKLKIKQNHAPCNGENNSHAKKWILENPNNMIYYVQGTLKKFCIEHNISYSVLIRNRGIKIVSVFGKTETCINTIGWRLIENE